MSKLISRPRSIPDGPVSLNMTHAVIWWTSTAEAYMDQIEAENKRLRETIHECALVMEACKNTEANRYGMVEQQISEAYAALSRQEETDE